MTFHIECIALQFLVACHAVHIGRNAVFFLQNFSSFQGFVHNGSATQQIGCKLFFRRFSLLIQIHSFQNTFFYIAGHWRHRIVFVHNGNVVEHFFLLFVHTTNTIANNHGQFVGKSRIVSYQIRNRISQQMTVSVLMLKSFACQRGSSCCTAHKETFGSHIGSSPYKVADALKSEHRVIHKERHHVDAVRRISSTCRYKRRHGAGLGNSFFENLSVFGFFVIKQQFLVNRLVKLSNVRVNTILTEERFHSESTGFVGYNRHNQLTNFFVF